MYLKQSTPFTFRIGPFLDDLDGNTEENSLSVISSDFYLSKAGAAMVQKNEASGGGTGSRAHYVCSLDATDTNTVGNLRVWCHVSGALPVFKDFIVLPSQVYDSIVLGTDLLNVEADAVEGTYTLREMLRMMAAVLFGKASGGGTSIITFRDTSDATDRVVATVDSNGNRTAVTLDAT